MSARASAWASAVLMGAVVTGACTGTATPPAPPTVSPHVAPSASSVPPAVPVATSLPLLPMGTPLGNPACGGNYTWQDWPARKQKREQGGKACYAIAGCPPPEPRWAGKVAECPPWPRRTMEEVVREVRTSPSEQDLVVQGRLVVGTGAWWPRLASLRETPCDEDTLSLSLEATIQGECYAIGVSRNLLCDVDASRMCCDHLPLNQEVAFAGRLSHRPGLDFFFAWMDGVICRLPPDATSTPQPGAGGSSP